MQQKIDEKRKEEGRRRERERGKERGGEERAGGREAGLQGMNANPHHSRVMSPIQEEFVIRQRYIHVQC